MLFKHLPEARWTVCSVFAIHPLPWQFPSLPLPLSFYLSLLTVFPTQPPKHTHTAHLFLQLPHHHPLSLPIYLHLRILDPSSPIRLALARSSYLPSNCPVVADWHVSCSHVTLASILIVCRCGGGGCLSVTCWFSSGRILGTVHIFFFFWVLMQIMNSLSCPMKSKTQNVYCISLKGAILGCHCHLHLSSAINVSSSKDKWSTIKCTHVVWGRGSIYFHLICQYLLHQFR